MAEEIQKVDLLCGEHEVALTSPAGQVVILVPVDKYSSEGVDYSFGWEFELDVLQCPKDPDGGCVDSWKVIGIGANG